MKIGDTAEIKRVFTAVDIAQWHDLTGGHVTEDFIPRPLIASLFSYLLGVHLPGPGTNYLKQEIEWLGPARPDTPLTASVTITRLRPEKNLTDLETTCHRADGEMVCTGRALVYVGDVIS